MKIKRARKEDLQQLNKYLPTNIPNFHEDKIKEQETGNSAWLIAWKKDVPVGHLQIRFNGGPQGYVAKFIQGIPYIEATGVAEAHRRQGIASNLVEVTEKLVKEKGYKQIGLAVGDRDNPGARSLYEELGYKNWEHGTFFVGWKISDKDGKIIEEREKCTYLLKDL